MLKLLVSLRYPLKFDETLIFKTINNNEYLLLWISVLINVLLSLTQGVDYLKYDNCYNLDIRPKERLVLILASVNVF